MSKFVPIGSIDWLWNWPICLSRSFRSSSYSMAWEEATVGLWCSICREGIGVIVGSIIFLFILTFLEGTAPNYTSSESELSTVSLTLGVLLIFYLLLWLCMMSCSSLMYLLKGETCSFCLWWELLMCWVRNFLPRDSRHSAVGIRCSKYSCFWA